MKKIIRLLALMLALCCLASCDSGNKPPVEEPTQPKEETTAAPEEPQEPPQAPLELIKDGKTEYQLICSTNADVMTKNAMTEIREAFQDFTGVSIGTGDDFLKEGETHDADTHR